MFQRTYIFVQRLNIDNSFDGSPFTVYFQDQNEDTFNVVLKYTVE